MTEEYSRPPAAELTGFRREPMVEWFDPLQLEKTVMPVYIAAIFGAYADRREMMAALDPPPPMIYDEFKDKPDLWVDFVADTGDGWDSTYSVAYLLSRASLTREGTTLPRGQILIMGGDQVYPIANRDDYQNRLIGPYTSALPVLPDEARPQLFAIPGNHDWYDGLRSFLRLFCQQRPIGAWQTKQSRSYWAVQLPHRWWLWGTDIQLQTDIDRPQLDYFQIVARDHVQPGDRIILCTASPSWVKTSQGKEEAYHNLLFFEQKIIRANKAVLAATLTGDLHCYARYVDRHGERPKIIAGGGGAFLYPTHDLPTKLELEIDQADKSDETPHDSYVLAKGCRYPDEKTSSRYVIKNLWFAWTNRKFSLILLAPIYMLLMWSLQRASLAVAADQNECRRVAAGIAGTNSGSASPCVESINFGRSFMDQIGSASPERMSTGEIIRYVRAVLARSPSTTALVLFIVIGFGIFAGSERAGAAETWKCRAVGGIHGILHVAAAVWLLSLFARFAGSPPVIVSIALLLVSSALIGGTIVGLYLIITHKTPFLRMHTQEVFVSQSIPDYKNFLRMHVTEKRVTIYPIGIPRVSRNWRFVKDGSPDAPWFEPKEPIDWKLIEEPTVLEVNQAPSPI